jgi:hypothetical protein
VSCAICEIRKDKRFCLAVHGKICATCCGTEREVTLDCPSECVYLQQSRKYDKPREVDTALLFPEVEIERSFTEQRAPLMMFLNHGLSEVIKRDRRICDHDLIDALSSFARTYHVLVKSGLVYEPASPSPVQQMITSELQNMVEGYRVAQQQRLGTAALRDSDVLKAVVAMLRVAHSYTTGRPKSRAFVEFVVTFPTRATMPDALPAPESRIVIP